MKYNFLIALCLLIGNCYAKGKTNTNYDKTSVTITEDGKSYELSAIYDEALTTKVQKYMDDFIGEGSKFSFKNIQTDAVLTLDNKLTFYMKSSPGKLILKFDKRKNSIELYNRFKKMCEGIRDIIQKSK
jgi:hypothetical protein